MAAGAAGAGAGAVLAGAAAAGDDSGFKGLHGDIGLGLVMHYY